jgi:hypothetical protein
MFHIIPTYVALTAEISTIFTLLKISISVSVLLQKLSNVNKTWMLLGPRYRRMGGGCVAYF